MIRNLSRALRLPGSAWVARYRSPTVLSPRRLRLCASSSSCVPTRISRSTWRQPVLPRGRSCLTSCCNYLPRRKFSEGSGSGVIPDQRLCPLFWARAAVRPYEPPLGSKSNCAIGVHCSTLPPTPAGYNEQPLWSSAACPCLPPPWVSGV